jgi:hypothetical protein
MFAYEHRTDAIEMLNWAVENLEFGRLQIGQNTTITFLAGQDLSMRHLIQFATSFAVFIAPRSALGLNPSWDFPSLSDEARAALAEAEDEAVLNLNVGEFFCKFRKEGQVTRTWDVKITGFHRFDDDIERE